MSSFVGHTLAALGVAAADKRGLTPRQAWWALWLIVLALAPDVDYLVAALRLGSGGEIRITHSLAGCLLLPALTCLAIAGSGADRRARWLRCGQALLAGLSHLGLDLLVGVHPEPIFWPLSDRLYRMPFGLLPSAGRLDLANPLLYRNILLEIGILGPLIAGGLVLRHDTGRRRRAAILAALGLIAGGCMLAAASLER